MKNNVLEDLLKETSLEIRLDVLNRMSIIALLIDLGYREDKEIGDDEEEKFKKLFELSKILTKNQIKEFNEWEADGRP